MSGGLTRSRARGVSIVEVLVALLVLSIGMLGIAGLFVESVRNSRTALLRTQAVNLVSDMGDRIRSNANAREAYDMGLYDDAPSTYACAPTADDAGDNCSITELAEDDLARWQAAVRETLPATGDEQPRADVEFVEPDAAGQPDRYRIVVEWREPAQPDPSSYRAEISIMPRPAV
jgi:type IV pilus assembly protein PilV